MSIDWLQDLERAVDDGKTMFACPGLGRNQWIFSKNIEDLKKQAKRTADTSKLPVNVVSLVSKNDAVAGDMFLVPTNIGDPGTRGEPVIQWKTIETKEAAEMMRDVRKGPAPFFAMHIEDTIQPASAS